MKAPDEIKKGLEHCSTKKPCTCCPMWDACKETSSLKPLLDNALALIQQLETKSHQLIEKIEQLEAHDPRWISVEERLPEECTYVIVYLRSRYIDDTDIWHIDADCFDDGDWHRYKVDGYYEVTHWMPLPEPPKE